MGSAFVLAKRDWAIDTSRVHGAHELHPILSGLRDRLQAGSVGSADAGLVQLQPVVAPQFRHL